MSKEAKLKHLELIQGVINRLATNSFKLKGWCVTLVVGVLLFTSSINGEKLTLLYLSFIPIISLWLLDGYFLWQECIFRKIYDYVSQKNENDIDFKMKVNGNDKTREYWIKSVFSIAIWPFYLSLTGSVIAVIIFLQPQ